MTRRLLDEQFSGRAEHSSSCGSYLRTPWMAINKTTRSMLRGGMPDDLMRTTKVGCIRGGLTVSSPPSDWAQPEIRSRTLEGRVDN